MNLLSTKQWSPLVSLQDDLNRLFGVRGWPDQGEGLFSSDWAPAVDIKEEKDRYVVRADLPGVDPKDIEVTMSDGILSIKGERKEERKEERDGYHRVERFSGSFFRRITLPDAASEDAIKAKADNGVLEISIPKTAKHKARKIKING